MPFVQGGALKTCGPSGLMTKWTRVTLCFENITPTSALQSAERAKGRVFLSKDAPTPEHTPQLGPMVTGQQVASDDRV